MKTYIVLGATSNDCLVRLNEIQTILDHQGIKNKLVRTNNCLRTDKVIYLGVPVGSVTCDGYRCFDFDITYHARRRIQSNYEKYGFWNNYLWSIKNETPPV